MELKPLIASAKGTFGSVPAVEELSAFHTEMSTVQEEKHTLFLLSSLD